MDEATKLKLKSLPKYDKCSKCGTGRSHSNPLDKCFECGKRFCFDHIYGGATKKSMKINEPVKTVCEECFDRYGYTSL